MAEGVVKWFDPKKGYGFIDGNGEPDIFIHYSSIAAGQPTSLNQGDKVTFQIVKGEKGPRAEAVMIAK